MNKHLSLLLIAALLFSAECYSRKYRFFIGTYTNTGKSEGIYLCKTDFSEKTITPVLVARNVINPSYLALSPDRKQLYAVNQNAETSTVSAFGFTSGTDSLTLINRVAARGASPCYIAAAKHHVFTANYADGSISVLGRNNDGSLSAVQQLLKHTGRSSHPTRQSSPHVHQTILTPNGKYLAVCDLGTDKVILYRYNRQSRSADILTPCDSVTLKKGSGPRHLAFSRNGENSYVLQELDGSLTVLSLKRGRLSVVQESTVVTKPGIETGAADIHLSPDGRFLYATNRGRANDITCFGVQKDGRIIFKSQLPCGGSGPRNFAITPDGQYLLVANQYSDNIVVFKRDTKTGALSETGMQIRVGAPVCITFAR